MIILSVDPAKKSGISLMDTTQNTCKTAKYTVNNPYDYEALKAVIDRLLSGIKPDKAIIEHPFLPSENTRSITGYDSHMVIYNTFCNVLYSIMKSKPARIQKGKFNATARLSYCYPSTWQNATGVKQFFLGDTIKDRSKLYALRLPFSVSENLSFDEYDAINIGWYYWQLAKPLNIKSTDPQRQRIIEIMERSGYIVPTKEEYELRKGR